MLKNGFLNYFFVLQETLNTATSQNIIFLFPFSQPVTVIGNLTSAYGNNYFRMNGGCTWLTDASGCPRVGSRSSQAEFGGQLSR